MNYANNFSRSRFNFQIHAADSDCCFQKKMNLLCNVHRGSQSPSRVTAEVKGGYQYYHYGCDDVDDRGWGCGYRTLQTLCSWVKGQHYTKGEGRAPDVPALKAIQQTLADIGDKPQSFIGSKQWIGSVEVGLVLDTVYDVPCKIVHISSGSDLEDHIPQLMDHFQKFGSPIMMGGSTDNSSKGVMGAGTDPGSLLILDPHYFGPLPSPEPLHKNHWVCWRTLDFFSEDSFYNLCLPQLKSSS